jgi:hypothetical protein
MGNAMKGLKFAFCEGGDDQAVISGVAEAIGLSDLRIEPFLGKSNLRAFLRHVQTRPEFAQNQVASVAVVRDADDDGTASFRSVRDALLANGFKAPEANGAVVANGVKVGILIIGPNSGKGMLEDLCLKSVSDRAEFGCVDDYFRCITEKCGRIGFSAKAKVRVWMASQADYDYRVGKAAEHGYWPWANPAFQELREFLRQL